MFFASEKVMRGGVFLKKIIERYYRASYVRFNCFFKKKHKPYFHSYHFCWVAPESSYIMVFLMDLTDLCSQDIHASPSIITELTSEWTEFEWNRNKIKIKWNKLFLKNGIYLRGTVGCFVSSSYCTVTVNSKFDRGGAAYPPDATAPMLVSSLVSCLRLKYFQFMFHPPLSTFLQCMVLC